MDGHLVRKKSGFFVANLRNSLICLFGYYVGFAPQIRSFFIPIKARPDFCKGSLNFKEYGWAIIDR